MNDTGIRLASPDDAKAVRQIYSHYILHTAVAFEYNPPDTETVRRTISRTLEKYPYFVALHEGRVIGYAYAHPFVGRAAYDWGAELTIYLSPPETGHGFGRRLYETLERALSQMGILTLYACIAIVDRKDEYLTDASPRFHERLGFKEVARFRQCGYKFHRWYDMIWMEKTIGEHQKIQPPITPFPMLKKPIP